MVLIDVHRRKIKGKTAWFIALAHQRMLTRWALSWIRGGVRQTNGATTFGAWTSAATSTSLASSIKFAPRLTNNRQLASADMRERITFIHGAEEVFDPSQLKLEKNSLRLTELQAAREDRLTFGVDELPQEVREKHTSTPGNADAATSFGWS